MITVKKKFKDKVFNYRFATEKDVCIINNFDKNIFKTVNKDFYYRYDKKFFFNQFKKRQDINCFL